MRSIKSAAFLVMTVLFGVSTAHAQEVTPPAGFSAFTMPFLNEDREAPASPTFLLLSDTPGKTVFSMPDLQSRMQATSGGTATYDEYALSLGIVPRAGFVITGFELSGTLNGALRIGLPPSYATSSQPGTADNSAHFGILQAYPGNVQVIDLDGEQDFSFLVPAGQATPIAGGGLAVDMFGFIYASATYTRYSWLEGGVLQDNKVPSFAAMSLSDARFTVHWAVVPVPEPGMWMMLAVGLIPVAGRRMLARRALS